MSEHLWDVKEASQYLGVSEKFIRRHARELGAFKVGPYVRLRPELIDRYLEQRSLDARTSPSPKRQPVANSEKGSP